MQLIQFKLKSWAELEKSELYQLLQLRAQIFVVEQECAYQDLDGQDPEALHLLASDEHQTLVAYARLYETQIDTKDYVAIGRVCTAEAYRGQGISRQLMQQAISYIESNQKKPITVSAQAYLEQFYQSLGFATVSEPYLEDGIPHIRMIKDELGA
ncbi:GNAT family N-acetyltransferase [Kangiella spongicola]|uniref:GNAT family N-acetyltransferase n=1 Tax=Kangiella spongicola TaxID=796379 RepID=UPI0018C56B5C|nr:GNAT family N-acetyltransferase [Kangiella spongicola]